MDFNEAKLLIEAWYSEQIPTKDWLRMIRENPDLRIEYELEKKRREDDKRDKTEDNQKNTT